MIVLIRVGATWEHLRTDDSGIADGGGMMVESTAPKRLVFTWADLGADPVE